MSGFLPVRPRYVSRILKNLGASSGTGPDKLPAYILKQCHTALALPIAILVRVILKTGTWPDCWELHWLFPLHKKKAKSEPLNYRGIHLTSQLSKVVERVLGKFVQPFLQQSGAFGPRQFAYMKQRGAKDALALNAIQWILWISTGQRVGLYCSDVSGAFDRVSTSRLMQKLEAKGIHDSLLKVIHSWLGTRSAVVVVDGTMSAPAPLANSVYQGTVLGPPLWNCHYEDARKAVNELEFTETIFADDLNAFRAFDHDTGNEHILHTLHQCQKSLHDWGQANQVLFDAAKETFHILDRKCPHGDNFKLLGVTFDTKVVMDAACFEIAGQAHSRLKTLLRGQRFFALPVLVRLYKSQILSFVEYATPAIYHAPDFFLLQVDRVQTLFLEEVSISAKQALLEFNLAPLSTRRDIAMLGLLFRIVRGSAPPEFAALIKRADQPAFPRSLRNPARQHGLQLHDPVDGTHSCMMERSILGLIYSFNMLPPAIVHTTNVSAFQHRLQNAVKTAAKRDMLGWEDVLRNGIKKMTVLTFQELFNVQKTTTA
jgi:hypothetical protein